MPWWIPPPIYIEKDPLDSMINHEKSIALMLHHWHIYTDGSEINEVRRRIGHLPYLRLSAGSDPALKIRFSG